VRPDSAPRSARWLVLLACAPLAGCWTGGAQLDTGYTYEWEMDPDQPPIPFGLWGLNGFHTAEGLRQVEEQFGIAVFHTSTHVPSWGVGTMLPMARSAGLRVNLRMAGDHHWYTDGEGNFDLAAWKAMLEPWRDSGVQEFIDDGTLAYHLLLDDISTFEGRSPTGDELEEMARYSKSVLPGLKVAVREEAARMPVPVRGSYEFLDAAFNQYVSWYGDVEEYAFVNEAAAHRLGLELVNGLNIADGGNGSSGQPGWSETRWAMSAAEIVQYGYVLSAVPDCALFMAWEYDGEELWSDESVGSDYFDRPENTAALYWLGRRLAGEDPPRP